MNSEIKSLQDRVLWCIAGDGERDVILHGNWGDICNKKPFNWNSRSPGYETKEELIEKQGILPSPCTECGSPIQTNYYEPTKTRLIEKNVCFSCDHWLGKIDIKDNPRTVRVNNTHYYIEDDAPNAPFQGFGGQKFVILFDDGRKVVTRNLWCQGNIPSRFRDRLPDNARFLWIY
jgi:hypothetical protein